MGCSQGQAHRTPREPTCGTHKFTCHWHLARHWKRHTVLVKSVTARCIIGAGAVKPPLGSHSCIHARWQPPRPPPSARAHARHPLQHSMPEGVQDERTKRTGEMEDWCMCSTSHIPLRHNRSTNPLYQACEPSSHPNFFSW